jgi:ubiquinone/menaquinone biosynthesis C-methylase UbiE
MIDSVPEWHYDESRHVGIDYSLSDAADAYEKEHSVFRDYDRETAMAIEALGLGARSNVLDMGCGTGGYALRLAKQCNRVYAVDISQSMLSIASRKAARENMTNITFVNKGLLTYVHQGEELDAAISALSLHHLPDFWKMIALKRLHDMLRPGGQLFLLDVVFCFEADDYRNGIEEWLREMKRRGGDKIMRENSIHIKEEFSTWDWIVREMLIRAGFEIREEANPLTNIMGFLCVKK